MVVEENSEPMRVLITGVHGFVGSNLVRALKDKFEIYGLDIVSPAKEGVVKTYSWDDLDRDDLPAFDAIIHLAGKAHDTKNKSAADVYFKVNTDLTVKIYDWFLASQAQKFIFFSSVKAAADFVPGDVLTEDVTPNPVGPYGESKIKAEDHIRSKWDKTSKTSIILRPCMIHGPGNKGNLNLLWAVVRSGIPWPLGSFSNKRTFTSVGNLCYVIENLLCQNVATGIYNMADDEALSTNELVEVMCGVMEKKAHILHLPQKMMLAVAKMGSILHFPLNTERLTKLTENYVVSNHKIKTAIGISQMPVRAKDGIALTVKSFMANKN